MTAENENSKPGGIEERVIETLIDLREERGWSQSELARKMVDAGWPKYTQMTVSRTEKGERPIRLDEADALASVFGIDLYNLWTPRRQRLYFTSSEQVSRLAADLETLIERYLDAQATLAIRADAIGLDESEISHVAAQLMETPESIAAKVRNEKDRMHGKFVDALSKRFNAPKDLEAENHFWQTPESERRLLGLFGELNGEHPEAP